MFSYMYNKYKIVNNKNKLIRIISKTFYDIELKRVKNKFLNKIIDKSDILDFIILLDLYVNKSTMCINIDNKTKLIYRVNVNKLDYMFSKGSIIFEKKLDNICTEYIKISYNAINKYIEVTYEGDYLISFTIPSVYSIKDEIKISKQIKNYMIIIFDYILEGMSNNGNKTYKI